MQLLSGALSPLTDGVLPGKLLIHKEIAFSVAGAKLPVAERTPWESAVSPS